MSKLTPSEAEAELARVSAVLDARGVKYEPMTIGAKDTDASKQLAFTFPREWGQGLSGMDLVTKIIDPEIRKFDEWFSVPSRGNGSLTRLERDLLRSYLYQKLTGVL